MAIKDLKSKREKTTTSSMLSMDTADSLSKAISENESDAVNKDEIRNIKISSLRLHEDNIYNRNDTPAAINELAESIRENGLMHNAVVTQRPDEGGYIILSGERRYKAYELLYNEAKQKGDAEKMKEYSALPCKVLNIRVNDESLRRNAEQLYLDTANIFTREGIADNDLFEQVSVRYINNLMVVYGMTEAERKNNLKVGIENQSGIDKRRTIDRNMRIYRELIPELYNFVHNSENDISKKDAMMLTDFTVDEQKVILDVLKFLSSYRIRLGLEYTQKYTEFQKAVYALGEEPTDGRKEKLTALALSTEDSILAYIKAQNTTARSHDENMTSEMLLRRKYAKSIDNAYTQVAKLGAKKTIRQLKALENANENDISLIAKLDELSQLIEKIKSDIRG